MSLIRIIKAFFKRPIIEVGSKWVHEDYYGNPFNKSCWEVCEVKNGWVEVRYYDERYESTELLRYHRKAWVLRAFYIKLENKT